VLYQRVDNTSTIQINASERTDCASDPRCGGNDRPDPAPDPLGTQPAEFRWASEDGTRVFFTTAEQLTDDDDNAFRDLYLYDGAARAGAHLTLVSVDQNEADRTNDNTQGVVGASADGHYVYFTAQGLLVTGTRGLAGAPFGLYMWHDGELRLVAPLSGDVLSVDIPTGANFATSRYDARVTPDGRHLLFTATAGTGVLSLRRGVDYDHAGFRQKYVYNADADTLECASCRPSGAPATTDAMAAVRTGTGASVTTWHVNHSFSNDGRHVFFWTPAALVPDDTNGRVDVYDYDTVEHALQLVSSGKSTSDSYFMDAGADGRDVFFVTRERLVGWDVDTNLDVYDARIGGGFPEPPAPPVPCSGAGCRSQDSTAPANEAPTSTLARGGGDESGKVKPRPKRCRRGFVKKRVRGKRRCVRRARHGSHRRRGATRSRRAK
jgi:hypothetical protein